MEYFLVVERRWCSCSFSLLRLVNRRFSRENNYKNFSEYLFKKSELPLQFRRSRQHSPPQVMRSFSDFFFVALLPLSYRQGKYCTFSVIRSSEAATGGVVFYKKNMFLSISQISQKITCVRVSF